MPGYYISRGMWGILGVMVIIGSFGCVPKFTLEVVVVRFTPKLVPLV